MKHEVDEQRVVVHYLTITMVCRLPIDLFILELHNSTPQEILVEGRLQGIY
jgi:hypothetical protein